MKHNQTTATRSLSGQPVPEGKDPAQGSSSASHVPNLFASKPPASRFVAQAAKPQEQPHLPHFIRPN